MGRDTAAGLADFHFFDQSLGFQNKGKVGAEQPLIIQELWKVYPERGSNPHGLNGHRILDCFQSGRQSHMIEVTDLECNSV